MKSDTESQDSATAQAAAHDARQNSQTASRNGCSDTELLATLFELGREVTSVLDFDELLQGIPQLIARLIPFSVFSVYLLDERRGDLSIAYAVGYPEEVVKNLRLQLGQGVVGAAVVEQRPIRVGDASAEPRWMGVVANMQSGLAVPLRHKGKVLGALNLLSEHKHAFSERDEAMLLQFGAHIAQALVNARLFESEREYAETLETLAEIGREMSAILDLDELLTRLGHLVKRLIDYRTFGIALINDDDMLELKMAISYGDTVSVPPINVGDGLVGYAALHKEPVLVADVSKDPRYIDAVKDVQSELAIPLLLKDRCIGVIDLESPELDAFSKKHVELLTLLASQAAVAIENARLYEAIRDNEVRLEKEIRFAQRVQMALLPQELPKKLKGVDVSWHFDAARELGGDVYDFLSTEPNTLVVSVGDVSGKGMPAALYGSFVGEVVRGRTFRRRFMPERGSPGVVLTSLNRILHERGLEEVLLHALLRDLRSEEARRHLRELGVAIPAARVSQRCQEGRAARCSARLLPIVHLRRIHGRSQARRRVRVLLGRDIRDVQRSGRGVRVRSRRRGGAPDSREAGQGNCGRDLRGDAGVSG